MYFTRNETREFRFCKNLQIYKSTKQFKNGQKKILTKKM